MKNSVKLALAALVAALSCIHVVESGCPVNKEHCKNLCKQYKHEVPRPTVFNWCLIGCHAAAKGQRNCKRQCKYSDLPRPTTTRACEKGCKQFNYEQKVCGNDKHHDPERHAENQKVEAAAETERVETEANAQKDEEHEKHNAKLDEAARQERSRGGAFHL